MKYIIFMILIMNILQAEKIITVAIPDFNCRIDYKKIDPTHTYIILKTKEKTFFLKEHPRGIEGKSSRTYINKNGKKISKESTFLTYKLKCLKEENVYFNCIEY
ncbi:MAG: hypothetical protein WC390_10895 [Sulfurimonas sp.]|jgi:hypothetical protein